MQHSSVHGLPSLIHTMNSLLITTILVILWAIGYFVYDLGTIFHVLIGMALITVGLLSFQRRKLRVKLKGKLF